MFLLVPHHFLLELMELSFEQKMADQGGSKPGCRQGSHT
ncbi:conserved hypothetical protein [Vibrio chagasii]|nr:conserved hypothetical protein [Vibrio chagasii]CAK2519120.1 conserved hypothetical protein [Vibrio crassostreae]CAH6845818.1 conserved hypothetical protein [Vibrio chagasii]CAH6878747.1 conserved hypothetical protein [Vibrio chagasii]CAH6951236.1 conserved hypothetical protein [Vibrio chagasii]